MEKTYLNGRITLSSTAAPSTEDMEKVRQLSEEDRKALVEEVLEEGRNSPATDDSMDDIWGRAVARARTFEEITVNAL